MAQGKKSDAKKSSRHKYKDRNDRESRRRYWRYDVLLKHKVRNLVRHSGMSREDAIVFWKSVRVRRLKKGV